MTIEWILLFVALVLSVSVVSSKVASRAGIPVLLIFIAIGMLLGSEGPGGLQFDNPWLTQAIGVTALVAILFSGGLDTQWSDVRLVWREAGILSTFSVVVSAVLVGLCAHLVFGLPPMEGILLGSIVASTDAAAVFTILRGQSIRLVPRVKSLIEVESGSNDPMAVFLTIGMIQLITAQVSSPFGLIPLFVQQAVLGVVFGYGGGRLMLWAINRIRLEFDGLYPVLTIALVGVIYGITAVLGGSGFLAVYLAGIIMRQSDFIHKRSLIQFHEGLAWLMQIVMFLTLGLQVFPSELVAVVPQGLVIAVFLMLIARPVSVMVPLLAMRVPMRVAVYVSWVGMRGAVPIILATFPLLAGIPVAETLFNVVFFIVLVSVLLQGTTVTPVARLLRLQDLRPIDPPALLPELLDRGKFQDNMLEVTVAPSCSMLGRQVIDLELPPETLLMLISRGDRIVVPRGSTVIEPYDRVLVLTPPHYREQVVHLLTR
ncbi:MAG: potassium/proton antiporter [Chloroflexi bacterium]|nr:potassium/proton antiporter [Chloroflexota bacterium]